MKLKTFIRLIKYPNLEYVSLFNGNNFIIECKASELPLEYEDFLVKKIIVFEKSVYTIEI